MAVISPADTPLGRQIKKKLGFPALYGEREYGACIYGEEGEHYGIYQVRTRWGGQIQVKEKFYTPANPQTVPQQANRQKWADAVTGWQALTELQKESYNTRAKYKSYTGYNLYIREYMLS